MRRLTAEQSGHLVILAMASAVVLASMILTPTDSVVMLFGWPVPPLCLWKNMTGLDCPGCGLTRSFTYMGHGEVLTAFARHKLGPLLDAVVALQVPWRAYRLLRSKPLGGGPRRD